MVNETLKKTKAKKFVIGIDPGDTEHKAVLVSPDSFPLCKPFSIKVNAEGFETFSKRLVQMRLEHKINQEDLILAIESSCNLWQTFEFYFKEKGYKIVKVSPMTTYLSRGLKNSNLSKSDNKDCLLVAESVLNGKFTECYEIGKIYERLITLNIALNKLQDTCTQAKLRVRGILHKIFPEFLNILDLDTATAGFLLKKYIFPVDYLKIKDSEITELGEVLKKLSQSQHNSETIHKLKNAAKKSIGIRKEYTEEAERILFKSFFDVYENLSRKVLTVGEKIIQTAYECREFHILVSVKGISEISAAQITAEVGGFLRYSHYKQIEKHAGLNLRINQSSKTANARHINKIGNKRLSKVLYQAARHVTNYVPEIRIKYVNRKQKHKAYKKNIIACISPLLRLLFSLVKNDKPYQLDENAYKELCALETKYNIKNKSIEHYTPKEKSRFTKKHLQNKI